MALTTTTRTIVATSTLGTPASCEERTCAALTTTADPSPGTPWTVIPAGNLWHPVGSLPTAGSTVCYVGGLAVQWRTSFCENIADKHELMRKYPLLTEQHGEICVHT